MIAKILSNRGGSGGANTISYAFGQTEHKDEHEAAECEFLTSNLLSVTDPTTLIEKDPETGIPELKKIPTSEADLSPIVQQFEEMAAMNTRVQNPYFHAVLSFDKDDEAKLDNEMMSEIAEQFMEDMGFKDCAWVATVHRDTDHTHIHLAACTVQNNKGNTVVEAYNNYGRAMESCRQIEADFGLKEVSMPEGGSRMDGRQDRATAHELRDIIDLCVHETVNNIKSPTNTSTRPLPPEAGTPLQTFCNKLEQFGVDVQFQFKEGRPTGISYSKDESSWSGGKLRGGGRFSLPGLEARGITYQEEDKDFCESVTERSKERREHNIFVNPSRFISECDVPRPNKADGTYKNAEPSVLLSARYNKQDAIRVNNSTTPPHYARSSACGAFDLYWRTNVSRSSVNTKNNNFNGVEAMLKKIKRETEEANRNDPTQRNFKIITRGQAPAIHSEFGDIDSENVLEVDEEGKPVDRYFIFGL